MIVSELQAELDMLKHNTICKTLLNFLVKSRYQIICWLNTYCWDIFPWNLPTQMISNCTTSPTSALLILEVCKRRALCYFISLLLSFCKLLKIIVNLSLWHLSDIFLWYRWNWVINVVLCHEHYGCNTFHLYLSLPLISSFPCACWITSGPHFSLAIMIPSCICLCSPHLMPAFTLSLVNFLRHAIHKARWLHTAWLSRSIPQNAMVSQPVIITPFSTVAPHCRLWSSWSSSYPQNHHSSASWPSLFPESGRPSPHLSYWNLTCLYDLLQHDTLMRSSVILARPSTSGKSNFLFSSFLLFFLFITNMPASLLFEVQLFSCMLISSTNFQISTKIKTTIVISVSSKCQTGVVVIDEFN